MSEAASHAFLEMRNVSKTFGGVKALRNVDLDVRSGEIHALMGENGAGKSTLMKILSGAYSPDRGSEIRIGGRPVAISDPLAAKAQGISIIYQELALSANLTAAENIFLGRELRSRYGTIDRRRMVESADGVLKRLGATFGARDAVATLTLADRQLVEIARAVHFDARILIMDEPTTTLSERETERLFAVVRQLRSDGRSIVYISHRMSEVYELSDRVSVLRDGAYVGTLDRGAINPATVVRMMVGRDLSAFYKKEHDAGRQGAGAAVLKLRDIGDGRRVRGCSFEVRKGEVLGLAGLVGAGRTELARLIFGADPLDRGEILLRGKAMKFASPRDAVKAGIGLVPEDRKQQGVVLDNPIKVNATMARMSPVTTALGFLRKGRETKLVEDLGRSLRLKSAGVDAPVSSLSGGNQQKVVLAKWFHAGGDVIILDEPTRGVDVGAKTEIYALVNKLAGNGKAVLVISSEHQELFGLCDRVLVMGEGELRGELAPESFGEENLLSMAMVRPAAAPFPPSR